MMQRRTEEKWPNGLIPYEQGDGKMKIQDEKWNLKNVNYLILNFYQELLRFFLLTFDYCKRSEKMKKLRVGHKKSGAVLLNKLRSLR